MHAITKSEIEVAICVDRNWLPIYEARGRYWVAGEPGKTYSIDVYSYRSHRLGRLEVLESVDGRNVLRDEPASMQNQGMIITDKWINRGWRINDNETRDFVFSDPTASIAAQATGSTKNVGVIGVAIFTERIPVTFSTRYASSRTFGPTHFPVTDYMDTGFRSRSAVSKGLAGGQSLGDAPDLGTGMGDLRADSVGHTTFIRARSTPEAVIEIQYRSREWLMAEGIITPDYPSAFPGDDTGYGQYVK